MSAGGGQESIQIKDLKEFAKRLKGGAGVVAALVTALPLTGLKWELWTPPWPPGASVISSVVCALWTLVLFFWRRSSGSNTFQPWLKWHIIAWIAIAAIYFGFLAAFTGSIKGHRYIRTPWLTAKATEEINAGRASHNVASLFVPFGNQDHDQDDIWRHRWVFKWLLLMTFLVSFCALAGYFSLHVLRSMALDIELGTGTWRN